ncbi:mechanosensitive ion channel family protein [Halorubrum sp. AJ67]|uniref:mechanosensitive ion channel family protein n=1 Tax=Halorubrum sp. AJ67 TaxID=1173487 RepID=UPI0003DBBA4F|nr:mechanosensitive ion channel domain-containing protein [Halorubrum sp. AJ67]CDK39813.1 mscS Mechanosensitive ion channel [Halorubrum sp. AJ67]
MITVQVLADLGIDQGTLTGIVVVLVAASLASRVVGYALNAVAERSPDRRISIKMLIPIARFLIYAAAAFLVLGPLLRLSTAQLLAVSGLLGAALGFGLKDLFAGMIGGLVLITERPYQVGDKVAIDGDYGEVTNIGLRSTTLVTPDDSAVMVPNATLFTANVSNANDGRPEMMVVVELAVTASADVDRASEIVEEAMMTSKYVYTDDDHPLTVLVEDESYYRTIRGKAYVADLRDEFAFASDVTERSMAAFASEGIDMPEAPVNVSHRR